MLLAGDDAIALSVSVTTRPPRPGEVDGVDYHFVSVESGSFNAETNSVELPNSEDLFLIEIWDRQGNLKRSSSKMAGLPPPSKTEFSDADIGGQQFRSYGLVGEQNLVRVSLSADVSDEQATNAAFQVALPAALVIPLSWLLLSFIIYQTIENQL